MHHQFNPEQPAPQLSDITEFIAHPVFEEALAGKLEAATCCSGSGRIEITGLSGLHAAWTSSTSGDRFLLVEMHFPNRAVPIRASFPESSFEDRELTVLSDFVL